MKSNRALALGIILSGLISALSAIVGNLASSDIPDPIKPLLHYIWPIFAAVTLAGIAFALWQARQREMPVQGAANPLHLSPALAAQNRQRLLAKVRSFWIKGVLENSLHGAALMALGLQEQHDAVANPWQLVLQEPDQSTRPLPTGTRIIQLYDEAVGELLILGEPGSGKTTLLLELARDLLDRAEKDNTLPMPLVFNLSSWAAKQQPLAEWLVDEMNTKYQVPRSLGQEWITADQVLPLLDGLDEVKKEYRPACVGAINTFRLQHGLVPTVVCSRKAEYLDLSTCVLLRTAVVIQPLSEKQIDEYLSSAGGQLEAVRVALREDQALQKLVTTPLTLSVLTLAYAGKPAEELVMTGTAEMRRRHLFEAYVHRMLQRRGNQVHYTHEQTTLWLTWLAQLLTQQNQTEFYLERLQPEWLPKSRQRRVYRIVSELVEESRGLPFVGLGILFCVKVSGMLSIGLGTAGLVFVLFPVLDIVQQKRPSVAQQSKIMPAEVIVPAEIITWSMEQLRRNLLGGLLLGILNALFLGLFISLCVGLSVGLDAGLIVGLGAALFCVLVSMLIGGISHNQLDWRRRVSPNQGIQRSLRNGLMIGLFFGLIGVLIGWLTDMLVGWLTDVLTVELFIELFIVIVTMQIYGVSAFIRHFVLRWFLRDAGVMPWDYVQFLDYAADRLLLRKVGGGYIFIHRLLLEYFASLPLPQTLVNDEQAQQAAPAQEEPTSPPENTES